VAGERGRRAARFRDLVITHAAMVAGDAIMVVALADSFFFDVDPGAARSRILAFLLVSFAPFLVIAPLVGPVLDRTPGGRRVVVIVVATLRVVLQIAMVPVADSIAIFPLVFFALVLQKTYLVSKSALVPSVVRRSEDLVEANAKLGVMAGLAGTVAVVPGSVALLLGDTSAALLVATVPFAVAAVAARHLPDESVPVRTAGPRGAVVVPPDVVAAARPMALLRAVVGFVLFQLAFTFRVEEIDTVWFGVALAASAFGTFVGNALAPWFRRHVSETALLVIGSAAVLTAAVAAVWVTGAGSAVVAPAVVVAGVGAFGAALGRLGFESIVQQTVDPDSRGATFARTETRFQLSWAVAAVAPVIVRIPPVAGYLVIGTAAAVALVVSVRLSRR
jgi:hypothetical protein